MILKEHSPHMENPIKTMDTAEVIDSNNIDAVKTIRCCNKRRLMKRSSYIIYVKVILIAM